MTAFKVNQPFTENQNRSPYAGTQTPGKACKRYIHGVWILAIPAGMTLLLKHLANLVIC